MRVFQEGIGVPRVQTVKTGVRKPGCGLEKDFFTIIRVLKAGRVSVFYSMYRNEA